MPTSPLDLPDEVLSFNIFAYLSPSDLSAVHQTCTLFHRVSSDNLFWKSYLKKYFPHYFVLFTHLKDIDYQRVFYSALKQDYQYTRQISTLRYTTSIFNKDEIKLFNAAKSNDLARFSKLLNKYDSPEKLVELLSLTDRTKRNIINWAGYFGHQRLLDCLFEKMSPLFISDGRINETMEINELTYFSLAILCNQITLIKSLTNDVLQTLNTTNSPILILAISCCHIRLIRYLVEECKLNLSKSDDNDIKPFYYAFYYGNSDTLNYVLSQCNMTQTDMAALFKTSRARNNFLSLHYLLKYDSQSVALETFLSQDEYALELSSIINKALQKAVHDARPELAIILLNHPACNGHFALKEPLYFTPYTFSPEINFVLAHQLFQAVKDYYVDVDSNYDTIKQDEFGNTLIDWVILCNQVDLLTSLTDKLSQNNQSSRHIPIYLAAICGHLAIVKLYLDNGVDVNTVCGNRNDATLLYTAARCGHKELVGYLISYPKIDLNFNRTALHIACQMGHAEIVSMLLEAGADINLADFNHCTALGTAAFFGHINILKILLAHPEIDADSIIDAHTFIKTAKPKNYEAIIELLEAHQASNRLTIRPGTPEPAL